ncbi:MAG TPA: valine--tRNA ligase [Campylobacterales bacterium]|nr:valine--tRNA ligase [Campylobacterales bacterium]
MSYNPKEIEENYYKIWEERGYFEVDSNREIQNGETFTIMMPPPNVTGSLHIGHALTFTLQDVIVRYKRMAGYRTLWQPGTDHAGIATQNIVEKQILAEGKTKEELGREKFLERVWEWKEKSGSTIVHQLRKLGVSPAWSRERFTMDEGLKKAVSKAFKKLYDDGMIVRGNYLVNWCVHDGALSDIEVEYQESNGKLYHIRYPLADSDEYVVVATTRPETFFGDTAVMVNPEDSRYSHLIGKEVILPLVNRRISIIADSHVDMEFGTGVVKVTPAHDPNDYEVGKRHGLEYITIFDEKGILNHYCGEFQGQDRLEARDKIVAKLQEEGYIEKIEEHTHQVGHCYRCKSVIEPYISKQWFLKKEVASRSIEKVKRGLAKFYPEHWINSYTAWMDELRDWCISRQLWWGHRIPVFTCQSCSNEWASDNPEEENSCPKCGNSEIVQDPDVLDTWFSSALWPFSTLGWGQKEGEKFSQNDLEEFYPNSLLITGFDILFFWVARMMMMGDYLIGELPFSDIYLHALVRDEHGEKMSKSKGNVIDPLDMVEKYSVDALRFTLAVLAVQGRDIRLSEEKLEWSRNFTNKLYNASKYLIMNGGKFQKLDEVEIRTPLGKYMMSKFRQATQEVHSFLKSYRFNDGATTIYRFLWNEFCDWGIELSKADRDSIPELGAIFRESMKLLHPYMPYITEYLYQELGGDRLENSTSIMIQPYPKGGERYIEIENEFNRIIEAIISIRRLKATIDLANKRVDRVFVNFGDIQLSQELAKRYIEKLAKVDEVVFVLDEVENCVSDIGNGVKTYISIESFDIAPILKRLSKQEEKLRKEIEKLEKMLSNERFIANAPSHVVETNRKGLSEAKEKLEKVLEEKRKLEKI